MLDHFSQYRIIVFINNLEDMAIFDRKRDEMLYFLGVVVVSKKELVQIIQRTLKLPQVVSYLTLAAVFISVTAIQEDL
ncbi:hypothetical protein B0I35DRAFT_480291 [Stachybotrys elegans]|uniref:Uncharacterized protein n=1 Tax=Stachybotrys elegans TaxID=80388 RepID=A0A8K0SNT1_9HYPO|nr:hypothetical protein B0I35DRAFT_480291 [Stachybotrys elegans]